MVHICFVVHTLPVHRVGGLENHAYFLYNGLANLGEKVTVFSTCHPKRLDYEHISENLEIYYFGHTPGIRDKAFFEQTINYFWKIHSSSPFDLIISESIAAIAIILAKKPCSIPIIMINHGFWGDESKIRWNRGDLRGKISGILKWFKYITTRIDQRVELHVQRLIVTNMSNYKNYEKVSLYLKNHLVLIYNGIDVKEFSPFSSSKFSDKFNIQSHHILVTTGRLAKEKGVQLILSCLPELKEKYPDICYFVSGEGEYLEKLQNLAKSLKVFDRVYFLGRISYEEIPELINNGDIYVYPTLRTEGLPYSVIEALACGAVIIGSDMVGVNDIIQNEQNGFLCRPKQEDYIKTISYVFENPSTVPMIKNKARKDAESRFSLPQMIENYRKVIYEIVQNPSKKE